MPDRDPHRRWVLLLTLGSLLAAFGCGGRAGPEPLRVAAAGDLRLVLPRLVAAFQRTDPGPVEPTFGASGQLAAQIRQGAPFDLFLSANQGYVQQLVEANRVDPGSVAPFARGSLVLALTPEVRGRVQSLSDLTRTEVRRVAIANPELAPYGLAARQALERVDLWATLEPKLVRAESVDQALQFVRTGNAEVGFVSRSLIQDQDEVIPVPPNLHAPILQSLGVVAGSKQPARAGRFAAFVRGEAGQTILRDAGFGRPEPDLGSTLR